MNSGFHDYRNNVYYASSTLYYALLGYPEEKKDLACAIYAFFHEVQETFYRSQDPLPIRVRLQWWRDEISKLFERKPSHPITRFLEQHLAIIESEKKYFFEIINGFEACLDEPPLTEAQSVALIQKTIGNREKILAKIFDSEKDLTLDIDQFGKAIGLTHFMKLFYKNFSTHLQILPIHSVEPPPKKSKKIKAISPALQKELTHVVTMARDAFPAPPTLSFFKRRYKMAQALIHKYEKKPELLLGRVSLTPIQKLFLAL